MTNTARIAGAIFFFTLLVFALSPIRQIADSDYSMLLSQSLLEHGTFKLDNYALPRLPEQDRGYFTSNGSIYQLEIVRGHIYYQSPPGSSILSVPYVALMRVFGVRPVNADGTYSLPGETRIEASLAALLMACLAVIVFYTARLMLPAGWSAVVALGTALGTQVWSTASRALWPHTWSLVLIAILVRMLLAQEVRQERLRPIWLASLLAWMFFVRSTNWAPILAVSVYLMIYHRRLMVACILTGAAWLGAFVVYSWYNFGQWLPNYYRASRLNSHTFWTGLAGNLVSPSRGLLIYVPVLFFIGYLVYRYWGSIKYRRLVILSLTIVAGHLITLARFPCWWGGGGFGARFTADLVPWFMLLAVLGLEAQLASERTLLRRRAELSAGLMLLAMSMFINGRGAVSPKTWQWNGVPRNVDMHQERLWDWREPQFMAGLVPPPLPQELPLLGGRCEFSTADAEKYLWYGWSYQEETMRWTGEKKAALAFSLNSSSDLELVMKFGAFVPANLRHRQRVSIRFNDVLIKTLVLNDGQPAEYKVLLPRDIYRDRNQLVFKLPDACSPAKLGLSADNRVLGLSMFWLEVRPYPSGPRGDIPP